MVKNIISKYFLLSFRDKILVIRIVLLSMIIRLMLLKIPFKFISKHIGIKNGEATYNPTLEERKWLNRISIIIEKVCFNTPWESKCLVQALIGQRLLWKRKLKSTLFFGVTKDNHNKLIAHAWLKCGDYYVTGRNSIPFGVVAKYMK